MTRRVKVACATITPSGSEVRIGYAAPRPRTVKAGKRAFHRKIFRQGAARASRALTPILQNRFLRVMREHKPVDPRAKYKRVVLKLSGEVLRGGKTGDPIDAATLEKVCAQVKEIHSLGVQVCVIIGGGNIFRGLNGVQRGVDRTTGDYMGMLATVINGLALMDCLEKIGVSTRVQSAIPMNQIAEPFILRRAMRHLDKGRVVIFVAGTGNPYFSTDTTAALRASELHADIILKATKVDGVYDKDPKKYPDAKRYDQLTFIEALKQRLNVMDSTAFSLCMDNNVPILVFDLGDEHAIQKAIVGDKIGTLVKN